MATLTIRLPDDKHLRLKKLAESQGLSVNKLNEYRQVQPNNSATKSTISPPQNSIAEKVLMEKQLLIS
jgi:hypothetical protein